MNDETLKAKEELRRRVDDIIAISNDDELAHSDEDDLHVELLHEYLPNELWIEIARLNNADFARWCA